MLKTKDNLYIAGHHPSKLDSRFDLVQSLKPDILAVDKPQDLQSYADRYRKGESVECVADALFTETTIDPDLFRRDCIRLMRTCETVGIEEVYFVDIPSYVRNIVPLYLEDKLGDQTTRENIMALRLKEIQLKRGKDKKIMMLVQDILQLNVFQLVEGMVEYDLDKVRECKERRYNNLAALLVSELMDEPICLRTPFYENTRKRTFGVSDQIEAAFHLILRDLVEGRLSFETAYKEAKPLVDQLQELTFKIYKLSADPEDTEFVKRVQKGKARLDSSIQDGTLKEKLVMSMI